MKGCIPNYASFIDSQPTVSGCVGDNTAKDHRKARDTKVDIYVVFDDLTHA